jgi:hypothetical protein
MSTTVCHKQLMGTIKLLESKNSELQKTSEDAKVELHKERVRSSELQSQVHICIFYGKAAIRCLMVKPRSQILFLRCMLRQMHHATQQWCKSAQLEQLQQQLRLKAKHEANIAKGDRFALQQDENRAQNQSVASSRPTPVSNTSIHAREFLFAV